MNTKIILTVGSCFLVLGSLSGCATSYGRQNDIVPVFFKTSAAQAIVLCEGQATELPGNVKLKRSSNHDCLAKAPGFQDLNFRVWSRVDGEGFRYSSRVNWQKWSKWTLGLGHLFAWPVDFLSGSMRNLENDHYDLKLHPAASPNNWDQASNMTRQIASAPGDIVDGAAGIVMNSLVKAPAEALGLASAEKRKSAEQTAEGSDIAQRMKAQ